MTATATARIVVQATTQEKKAISDKAKKLGLTVAELMRRGAASYQSGDDELELNLLADKASQAADNASASIDETLHFVEASNMRIAELEKQSTSYNTPR